MLVIRTIKLSSNSIKKLRRLAKVRVGYEQHVCSNKYPPRVYNQQIIQWKQDMTLPILFKRPLQFQFYTAHQFGYNPQQIDGMCYAKIIIQNYRKNHLQANVHNSNGQVVGRAYFQFQLINDNIFRKTPQTQTETNIYVSSMLAHFDHYYGEKGFFQVCIDDQYSATPNIDFIAGELLWAQKLSLPSFSDLSQYKHLVTKIYIDDLNVGNAAIKIKDIKEKSEKFLKISIISVQTNEKCGMIFMDIHLKERKLANQTQGVKKKSKSQVSLPSLGRLKFNNYGMSSKKIKSQKSERRIEIDRFQKNSTRNTSRVNKILNTEVNSILSWKLRLAEGDEKFKRVTEIDK